MVFWLPTYPDVMSSMIVEMAKQIGGNVTVVCPLPISEATDERYKNGALTQFCDIVNFSEDDRDEDYLPWVRSFFDRHKDDLYFFGGFFGKTGLALKEYSRCDIGNKAFVFTEKPSVVPIKHFRRIYKVLRGIQISRIYRNKYLAVADHVAGIFVTGEKGVEQLAKFGFPRTKVYEAMYTHNVDGQSADSGFSSFPKKEPGVRFVYIGRFNYRNRGMDNLIDCFNRLKKDGSWSLDLVGGYGEEADEIIAWAENTPHVSYIGEWRSGEVVDRLREYDVCISPTRIDGWRIQVNQAIMAGIATITTTEAISDELVILSDTGVVADPYRKKELRNAVEFVMTHPDTLQKWKENAVRFQEKITNEKVAEYLLKTCEYCLQENNEQERPVCPWKK